MTEERCETCRFSHVPGDATGVFFCRRHAPRPRPLEGMGWEWPVLCPTDWCGEWEGKAASALKGECEHNWMHSYINGAPRFVCAKCGKGS